MRIIVKGIGGDGLVKLFRIGVCRGDMKIAKTRGQEALLLGGNSLIAEKNNRIGKNRRVKLWKLINDYRGQ